MLSCTTKNSVTVSNTRTQSIRCEILCTYFVGAGGPNRSTFFKDKVMCIHFRLLLVTVVSFGLPVFDFYLFGYAFVSNTNSYPQLIKYSIYASVYTTYIY